MLCKQLNLFAFICIKLWHYNTSLKRLHLCFNLHFQDNFDYASAKNQELMHAYHQAFQQVDKIIKSESGTLPEFWLQSFQLWLLGEDNNQTQTSNVLGMHSSYFASTTVNFHAVFNVAKFMCDV